MLYTIIAFFSLAAILGLILITFVLKGKNTPKGLVFTHGPLAALALILLIVYSFGNSPAPVASIVLFIIAALGGFVLVYHDMMGKVIPKWLAVVHGLTAVTGFIFLLAFAFS